MVRSPSFIRLTLRGRGRVLPLRAVRHPSESDHYLAARLLAFALAWLDGLAPEFSPGLCRGREPAVFTRRPDGGIGLWIDVSRVPDAPGLRRAASLAGEVVCYCYGGAGPCAAAVAGRRLPRLRVARLEPGFLSRLAAGLAAAPVWEVEREPGRVLVSGLAADIHIIR